MNTSTQASPMAPKGVGEIFTNSLKRYRALKHTGKKKHARPWRIYASLSCGLWKRARRTRSADFQSAVSQDCILHGVGQPERDRIDVRPADCKSALRQTASLRYAPRNARAFSDSAADTFWIYLWPVIALAAALETQAVEPTGPVSGRELARTYCSTCHLFPEPELLDKATWTNGTLPLMRSRLGIDQLDPTNPQQKTLLEEWKVICQYYLEAAPIKAVPQPPREKIQVGLSQFEVVNPKYRPGQRYVTMVSIDEGSRQIHVGNADTKTLDTLDDAGRLLSSLAVESPPVSLTKGRDGWLCTLIGLVPPHDRKLGQVVLLDKAGARFSQKKVLLSDLARPTHCVPMDADGDGREDLIVSAFGNIFGSFSWYRNLGDGQYEQRILLDRPGALRCELHDFDGDGRRDLAVLMAQGKEGFSVFFNEGGGKFSELPALEQPPVWGYAGFQLVDFDGDGQMDLLTANGDNGEYPSCLKAYHGVRVYLNRGRDGFKEVFFYPIHGAFAAVAKDFDLDGDLDIACAAYFPDYAGSPEESFVYLENQGGMRFRPFSFPEAQLGRWLVMAAGDVDGDGDPDIVLGAANRTPYGAPKELYARWEREGPSILILKNRARH